MRELLARFHRVTKAGEGWSAQCPAHDDTHASLSIGIGEAGRALLKCHAGCSYEAIVDAAHLGPELLRGHREHGTIVATYHYHDEHNRPLYDVVRFDPKTFRQRAAGGAWSMKGIRRVVYRLPELKGATTGFIVEGEKDVDRLFSVGLRATTNVGGAGKWTADCTAQVVTAGWTQVVVIPDDDAPGRTHANAVASALYRAGLRVKVVPVPAKDVSVYLDTHSKADLLALGPTIHPWSPVVTAADVPEFETESPRYTDLAYAEHFVAAYGLDFRFDHRRHTWLHYERPHWQPDADSAVSRAAHQFARARQRAAMDLATPAARAEAAKHALKLESKQAITNVLDIAKTIKPVADTGTAWDTSPWLLGVQNGVVDLESDAFRDGDPADRLTMCCGSAYDSTAVCPRWWQFLAEVFNGNDEVIDFVWRLIGYALTGHTREHVVVMCYGTGSNGKSVFLSTLHRVCGSYGYTLPFASLKARREDGIPNDIAALVGKRFVTASEPRDGLKLDEGRLKWLTGGDSVSARFLHGEFFTFTPVAKFFLAMNHKPLISDDSWGLWRRIRLLPFNQQFRGSNQDETLAAQLAAEAPGILAWAVAGAKRWRESGLTLPEAVSTATDEYRTESDPLSEFVKTCVDDVDVDGEVLAGEFYKSYTGWCEREGLSKHDRLTGTAFGRRIAERFEHKQTARGRLYMKVALKKDRLW